MMNMAELHEAADGMKANPRARGARQYIAYLGEQWRRVTLAYALTVLSVVLSLAMPWPLKYLIDGVLQRPAAELVAASVNTQPAIAWFSALSQHDQILMVCGVLAAVAIITAIVLSFERVIHARVLEQFSLSLRADMIEQVYRISRSSRQQERSGELTMRLTGDVHQVARLYCKSLPLVGKQAATALSTLVALYLIEPGIGALATVIAVGFVALVFTFRKPLERAVRKKRHAEGDVASLTQEAMIGIEHVQAMALEEQTSKAYLVKARQALSSGVEEVRVAVRMERACQIYAGLSMALVACAGSLAVVSGDLTLGVLMVCLAYVTQLMKPIEKINESAATLTRGLVRARNIDQLFGLGTTDRILQDDEAQLADFAPIESIECAHLFYTYPGESRAVVQDFSHVFRKGEMTVLKGASGSGKSTILRLLMQLLQPDAGEISINGVVSWNIDVRSLRSQFAVLMQDAFLFNGTIREVLCELAPNTGDTLLRKVLQQVDLLDLLDTLDQGLDTPLGEAATRLSGGQRSRLLLARAMVSGRRVLILDEPFANIDAQSRQIILGALQSLRRDCLIIVVTHEDSLLATSDHVLDTCHWSPAHTTPFSSGGMA